MSQKDQEEKIILVEDAAAEDSTKIFSLLFKSLISGVLVALFAAIVRAPLTGIFLILEMTGGAVSDFLPLTLASYAAYFMSALCRSTPVYEALLNRLVAKK